MKVERIGTLNQRIVDDPPQTGTSLSVEQGMLDSDRTLRVV